jgi:hypothetical protein
MPIGVNFRSTAGHVSDGVNETYSRGQSDLYPTSRATYTFGWNNFVDMERNDNAAIDRRLAGCCKYGNNAAQQTWRFDLPAAGTYDITLALGRFYNSTQNWIKLQDNTTDLFAITGLSLTADQFADANGSIHSSANWPANNTKRRVTFSSTTARLILGEGGSTATESAIAHINFQEVASGSQHLFLNAIGAN